MDKEHINGWVGYNFGTPLSPWKGDPDQYAFFIEGTIKVLTLDDAIEGEHYQIAGHLKMVLIRLVHVRKTRMKLRNVFKCNGYDDLYAIFHDDPPFDFAGYVGDLLIIEELDLKSTHEDADLRHQTVENAIASFSSGGIVIIHKDVLRIKNCRGKEGYTDLKCQGLLMRKCK